MADYNFTVRPISTNGRISYELCHLNPQGSTVPQCGTTKQDYPDVRVPAGKQDQTFKFTIVNDQTGREIKFADDPIWIKQNGPPTKPIIHTQIEDVDLDNDDLELTFTDENDNLFDLLLTYRLNFTDGENRPVTPLDPDITNGGKGFVGFLSDPATLLLATAALIAALISWAVASYVGGKAARQELAKPKGQKQVKPNIDA